MRWIYLSPHLDDAALSAGGWLYDQTQAGHTVEMWTLMCGQPPFSELSKFAKSIHESWDLTTSAEVERVRKAEDRRAAEILGAKPVYLDFLDCIYRRGKNGEWLYDSALRGEPHPEDAGYSAEIAKELKARLQPDDQVICQFSIGKHVDHVVVRQAAESLGRPLYYMADIPYLFNHPDHLDPNRAGFTETLYPVSEAGVRLWQEAVLAYFSQMSMLFKTPEATREKIAQYAQANHGLRMWTK